MCWGCLVVVFVQQTTLKQGFFNWFFVTRLRIYSLTTLQQQQQVQQQFSVSWQRMVAVGKQQRFFLVAL